MEILIDTNVVLDMLQKRKPFDTEAKSIMASCIQCKNTGFMTAHSLCDIFYILRKDFDSAERKKIIVFLCTYFTIIPEDKNDFLNVCNVFLGNDIEDNLQIQCAQNNDLDYIITRNLNDFRESKIPVVTPADFLKININ